MENRVVEAIQKRRSVRSFEERIPDQNLIDEVMEAGLYAASGRGTQGTVIVQIDNKKLGKEIRELNAKIGGWPANFDPFYSAPVILIVLAKKNISTHVYDGSLVMGNLMRWDLVLAGFIVPKKSSRPNKEKLGSRNGG